MSASTMRRSTSGQARPGSCAYSHLLIGIAGEVAGLKVRHGQQGAGLRHSVAREHVDAPVHRLLGERLRQGRAPDHHLQSGEVDVGFGRRIEQHLQDGRHAMGEGHALRLDQFDKQRRIVTTGVDLFDACERRRPWEAPCVNMEHRGNRHIDVVAMESTLASPQRQTRRVPPSRAAPVAGGCSRRLSAGLWFRSYRTSSPGRSRQSQESQSLATPPREAPRIRRRIRSSPVAGALRSLRTTSFLTLGNLGKSECTRSANSSLTSSVDEPA